MNNKKILVPKAGNYSAAYESWLHSEFEFEVYSTTPNDSSKTIETPWVPILPKVLGGRIVERLTISHWAPPPDVDIVVTTSTTPINIPCRSHQTHIALIHGIRAPLFGHRSEETLNKYGPVRFLQYAMRDWVRRHDRRGLNQADIVVANSEFTAEMLYHYHGIAADEIIYPPINTDMYRVGDPSDYYLYLGRLHPSKGVKNIVETFNELDYRLIVAGSGPLQESLSQIADENVDIVGYVSEERKRDLFANARGFIQNTLAEPFGITTVESLASGTPVIAANVGNNPNLVEDRQTGILFDREGDLTDFDVPKSTVPLSNAVQEAEQMDWDYEELQEFAEPYDSKYRKEDWELLLLP